MVCVRTDQNPPLPIVYALNDAGCGLRWGRPGNPIERRDARCPILRGDRGRNPRRGSNRRFDPPRMNHRDANSGLAELFTQGF